MKIARLVLIFVVVQVKAAEARSAPLKDLITDMRTNIVARTNSSSTQMFASYVDGTKFRQNPRFWLSGMKGLSATQVGNGAGATAITPWHILEANHNKNEVGSKLYFCDAQNRAVVRTIVEGKEVRPDIRSDTWLAVLDSALPSSVAPMLLMPPDWTNHVILSRLPVAALNQQREFGAAEILSFQQPVEGWFRYGYLYKSSSLAPSLQFRPLKAGDSGRPIVTLVADNLVLLGHITFEPGERFAGPDYSRYGPDIQAAIKTLGTNDVAKSQQISIVDLSRFR
jgi:hypothetical protein